MDEWGLDFCYAGDAAGVLRAGEYPREPGRYRYMPYRGGGHYDLQQALQRGERPRCYYDHEGLRVWFRVVDVPDYGVLELVDFSTGDPGEPDV